MFYRRITVSTFIAAIIFVTFSGGRLRAADLPSIDHYGDRIVVRTDIPFANDAQAWQKLDLYLPKGNGPFPVVVCWFGGGFTGGNRGGMARVCAFLADKGIAAAAPGYYLASPKENKPGWPQNVQDAKCAVRFLRASAGTYHLDAERIAGLGHSSGAYLALMVGFTPGLKDLEGTGGWAEQSSQLTAVVNISGVCDRRGTLGTGTQYLLGKGYEDKADLRTLASPVVHITTQSPPVYTLHGEGDKTVLPDSAKQLNDALQAAGVEHELHLIAKLGHNPINVETMESVRAWLLKKLKVAAATAAPEAEAPLRDIADIRIRDPFILTDAQNGRYILVAKFHRKEAIGWECVTSKDLRHWQAPLTVFTPPEGFWADRDFWAPEIHAYLGKYYLLGTVSSDHAKRGTQIFVADQPLGPYRPHSDGPATPHDWMALDGTLHVENGHPWMVFCHEWLEVGDGTMNAVQLTTDLSKPVGEPIQLFRASEAPWVRPIKPGKYVTDGPWVYRTGNGKLLILWSSFSDKGYAVGIARSRSGTIEGPWEHDARPLFEGGGHCMVFRSLDGKPMLLLHAPNKSPDERAKFFEIHEDSENLRLEPVAWQKAK